MRSLDGRSQKHCRGVSNDISEAKPISIRGSPMAAALPRGFAMHHSGRESRIRKFNKPPFRYRRTSCEWALF